MTPFLFLCFSPLTTKRSRSGPRQRLFSNVYTNHCPAPPSPSPSALPGDTVNYLPHTTLITSVKQDIFLSKLPFLISNYGRFLNSLFFFFWVIPRQLNFICRRFGTSCLFHLHRQLVMKMEQTECFETSAYKIQTPGNYPEEKHASLFLLY